MFFLKREEIINLKSIPSTSQNNVTAVVLTFNEEDLIVNCLNSLSWAKRVVLVDSGSTDKTVEYARKKGCDIYSNPWPGFSKQRNWSLDNTDIQTDWVLFIDADEEVPPSLQNEILFTIKNTDCSAFYLSYKVMFMGKWIKWSSGFPVWHPRIVRSGKVQFKDSITGHGETWDVDGRIGYIKAPYIHYSFSKGIEFWLEKHNRLSTIEMKAYLNGQQSLLKCIKGLFCQDAHKKRQSLRALSYYMPFRPFVRFFYQLFLKGGILDGKAGWAYCCLYLVYEIMISEKILEQKHFE